MPASSSTLVLFVLLVLPGLVYNRRRETRLPPGTLSGFRETANVVVTGVACQVPALALIVLAAALRPEWTVDLRLASTSSSSYARHHFTLLVIWLVIAAATSCAAAAVWAVPPAWLDVPLRRLPLELQPSGLELRDRPPLLPGSAWTEAFSYYPEKYTVLGCRLRDGSYIEGNLGNFSPSLKENSERDLVLVAPITYAEAGEPDAQKWDGVGQIIVSAADIQLITVTHYDELPLEA